MKVKIKNESSNPLPEYAHPSDSGMDIRANLEKPVVLESLERYAVPTGIYVELPEDTEIQVRPRSGLAVKKGLTVLNSPGTIDAKKILIIGVDKTKEMLEKE